MRSPGPAFDLRAAMAQEVRAAIDELEAAEADPKAVHRCRVRLKRARALARVGKACAPGLSSVFNDSAAAVMHGLAHSRDVASLVEAALSAANKTDRKSAAALQSVAATLATHAERPLSDKERALNGLRDLLALAQVWPEASARQVRKGAKRIIRQAREARKGGHAASGDIIQRHDWRKREKDRLYAAIILDTAWPAPRRRKLGDKVADILGHERDAVLLIDRIEAEPSLAGGDKAAGRAMRALRRRRKKLARRANDLGKRLHADGA